MVVFAEFLLASFMPTLAHAGAYDCSATVNFGVSPTTITDSQSASISGSVTLTTPGGVICTIPGTNSLRMSQIIVTVFDEKSSKQILLYNTFTYSSGQGTNHTWQLNTKKIGVTELNSVSLAGASSLSLVAIVKVSDINNNWYQLTKSGPPIAVSINTSASGMPELTSDKYSVKLGDTINLSLKNAPPGWEGSININDQTVKPMAASPYPLSVIVDNGFNNNSNNSITLAIEVAGTSKPLKNNGVISVNVSDNPSANPSDPSSGKDGAGANPSGMQGQSGTELYNPISGVNNITELLLKIMNGFLAIIGIWAVIFIVIGGFRLVMSEGNDEAVAAAKKTITWAVLGLIAALLSFSIIAIIQNLLGIDIKEL